MVKDNKGFSLVELLIVVAITFIVAGLSVLTFNAANSRRPEQTMDNLVSYAKYSKSLVKSESKNYCMAIIKCDDGNYYAIQGTAEGNDISQLRSSFKSQSTESTKQTDPDTSSEKTIVRNNPDSGYSLAELQSNPTSAENYHNLGKYVSIYYEDQLIADGASNAMIIKYRKFDGSVISGAGKYSFSKYRSNSIKCSIVLEKSTGAFHK